MVCEDSRVVHERTKTWSSYSTATQMHYLVAYNSESRVLPERRRRLLFLLRALRERLLEALPLPEAWPPPVLPLELPLELLSEPDVESVDEDAEAWSGVASLRRALRCSSLCSLVSC